ncbi:MAG TPA: Hsp20/alpha crystallin family protein, partial [Vicinamibacteria bacterium]|nr:Hsp20/alpha crystallin family protein [Vicinamibacteria bacterium]
TASLPGVRPEDVDISLEDNVLTIRGDVRQADERPPGTPQAGRQRGAEDQADDQRGQPQGEARGRREPQYHQRERRVGRFLRQVLLPVPVDADRAEATFEHGELTLRLPKAEQAKRKRIPVTGQTALEGQARRAPEALPAGGKKEKTRAKQA